MPSKSRQDYGAYGAIVSVYPASESSSVPATPVTPRTPLLGEQRGCVHPPGTPCTAYCPTSTDDDETDVELTEQERAEYERGLVTWDRAKNWRFWIRREWTPLYLAAIVVLAAVSFVAIYHREVRFNKQTSLSTCLTRRSSSG